SWALFSLHRKKLYEYRNANGVKISVKMRSPEHYKKPTLWAGITDNRTVSVEINDVTHYTRWIHKPSLQMHWHPNQRLKQLQWPDL
ncbi:hypothetical protein ABUU59_01250, partial [Escherichia coli]